MDQSYAQAVAEGTAARHDRVMRERISAATARRIALAAIGLAEPRPAAPGRGHLRRVTDRLGLLQIDSVSVLARAHYLPLFSRLGAYDRALLDEAAWGRRPALFEYWAHEASLLPHATHKLLRWRMDRAARSEGIYGQLGRFAAERRPFIDALLHRVRSEGPMAASEAEGQRGTGGWWGWSDAKRAFEWLFWAGQVTTATRRASFERVYDIPERVLPAAVLDGPAPTRHDAHRALLLIAARALGIATAADLRDYFRLAPGDCAAPLEELVESGDLVPAAVEGWAPPAYVHRDARWPRRVAACALISPFDPAMWERTRAERLFGFRYRLEIYTPAAKRQHGYYVLPFLLGDRMVARVDLKADRAAGTLRVLSAHAEPHAPPETAERLLAELALMARWLGLEQVRVSPAGDFGPALAARHGNPGFRPALEAQEDLTMAHDNEHDPGDAVPPGVAPQTPAPLTEYDKAVRDKLRRIPEGTSGEAHPDENAKADREVAAISRTIQPKSDAPSRSGLVGSGSGADGEGL